MDIARRPRIAQSSVWDSAEPHRQKKSGFQCGKNCLMTVCQVMAKGRKEAMQAE
jgi:hypothetical protein